MIIFEIVLSISVLILALIALTKFHRTPWDGEVGDMIPFLQRVDVEAFAKLIDPAEEAYLRQRYTSSEFRQLQRQRIRLTIEYLRRMSHNAKILLEAGHGEVKSSSAERAFLGNELIHSGTHIRLYALLALTKLHLWLLFRVHAWTLLPTPCLSDFKEQAGIEVLEEYDSLKSKAAYLALARRESCHNELIHSL